MKNKSSPSWAAVDCSGHTLQFPRTIPPHLNAVALLFEAIQQVLPSCLWPTCHLLSGSRRHPLCHRGAPFPDALNSTMSPNTVMYFLGLSPTWCLVIKSKREKNNRGSFHSFRDNRCPFSQSFQTERHVFL